MTFYLRLIGTALRSLDSHFIRSLLATIGVLIGVSSVVACMSILEGASNDIVRRFKTLGSNVLYAFPATARVGGQPVGSAQTLVLEDMGALLRALPDDIERIAPEAIGGATVKRFQKSDEFPVIATSAEYFVINAFEPERGRIFNEAESNDESAAICLLGNSVAQQLFGGADAVGQTVKIGSGTYRVLAVMQKKGSLGFLNADDSVYIPIKAGLKRFLNRKWLNRLTIAAKDPNGLEELQKRVKRVLRDAHGLRMGQPDDFEIFNQEQALENITAAVLVFRVVFYSIAGISLVVGGIGIMNIMLVSVTERTREIGVRMATGARRSDILLQFLVEALIISFIGAGVGLLLGAMFADVMSNVLRSMNFKTEITPFIVIVSLLTAVVVGVISGIYPAFKASRLDPVEALRYE